MATNWQEHLSLEGKNPEILGSGHQILFKCQEPGVSFPWVQIVHSGGNIYAARVLTIILPQDTPIHAGDTLIDILWRAKPENCKVVFIHEKRPYPALVADYPGTTLRELPGGVIEQGSDVTLAKGAVREFLEELGANESSIVAGKGLLRVPAPASGGAQIEGHYLHCILYRGNTDFIVQSDEPIARFELVPLTEAYHSLKEGHEDLRECADLKTFLALLMLQQEYMEQYGSLIFSKKK